MFETYSVHNFTKRTPKIVAGKYWMMKLWKIDTRYIE